MGVSLHRKVVGVEGKWKNDKVINLKVHAVFVIELMY